VTGWPMTTTTTTTAAAAITTALDQSFHTRVENALKTVQAWEEPTALAECRATIPFAELANDGGQYSRCPVVIGDEEEEGDDGKPKNTEDVDDDDIDVRFVQRLCRYFKASMQWVNQPPCTQCHNATGMMYQATRGPTTDAERVGQASRVEVYTCPQGQAETCCPRYDNVRTLQQTRRGRCGE